MNKEGPQEGEKWPFLSTKQFVQKTYDESYLGERTVSEAELDRNKPYTMWNGAYYQAEFKTQIMSTGDEVPLLMMPIDERPRVNTPSYKRRPNAALLYLMDDFTHPENPRSFDEIASGYGVSRTLIQNDRDQYFTRLYESSSSELQRANPKDELTLNNPVSALSEITLRISLETSEGVSVKELIQKYGTPRVSQARKYLLKNNLPAPDFFETNYDAIVEKIKNPTTSNEELTTLIKNFNRGTYSRYLRGRDPILIGISTIQMEAWGTGDTRLRKEVFEILKNAGVAVHMFSHEVTSKGKPRKMQYYISLRRTKDQAVEVLKNAKNK